MRIKTDDNKLSGDARTLEITGATTQTETDGHVTVATSGGEIATFTHSGVAVVGAGVGRYLLRANRTIVGAIAVCSTAPTGGALIFDVNLNGTTVFSTQANRPTIAVSAFKTVTFAVPDVTAGLAGDYLSVDIDQIGSAVEGADISVQVYLA